MRIHRHIIFFFLLFWSLGEQGRVLAAPSQGYLPLSSSSLFKLLKYEDFHILSHEPTEHGTTGTQKLKLSFTAARQPIEVKWKRAKTMNGEGWNNTPRREIAAYQIQKFFLDPSEEVVPPTVIRCIPLDEYAKIEPRAEPNIGDFPCVYGMLAAWVQNVKIPKPLFDRKRFEEDPAYARSMANLNLLCYLILHQDGLADNFLISTIPGDPRLFSIDNGLSFKWEFHYFFKFSFKSIQVPALPRTSIERLRRVTDADLKSLGVLEQFEPDERGILRPQEPGANLGPCEGSRLRPGVLQIGLTRAEIEGIRGRIRKLLNEVDQGKRPLF